MSETLECLFTADGEYLTRLAGLLGAALASIASGDGKVVPELFIMLFDPYGCWLRGNVFWAHGDWLLKGSKLFRHVSNFRIILW